MKKIGIVALLSLGALSVTANVPQLGLCWKHRFVFEAERDLPDGYAFLPAAHYSATVERLPAEMRFARKNEILARFAAPTNVAPPYVMRLSITGNSLPAVFVTKDGRTVRRASDARTRLCANCHAANAEGIAGSSDDRTPLGAQEGMACTDCHRGHGRKADATRGRCPVTHPKKLEKSAKK